MGSVRVFRETILEAISGLALHHVGFAVAAIELTTRSYVTRYGYAIRTPVIHDPLQTAFVQFLALPGDHVYLELVSPDGPESRLSSAVRRGGGLNHLCYVADDLEKVAEWLVQSEMMQISPPQSAVAFGGRRICWLVGEDMLPIELVERSASGDRCEPGI
jgi:methylmalonyl-CoA/ethylmalonyl-CoA epimerase